MEWIETKNKKPKYNKRVLVYAKEENIIISRLESDKKNKEVWHDDDHNTFTFNTVDFWMELPDLPNEMKGIKE